jgi:hypothetical protein
MRASALLHCAALLLLPGCGAGILDSDTHLAVSGCGAVMDTLFTMVHNPPQELAQRTVFVSEGQPRVPYTVRAV